MIGSPFLTPMEKSGWLLTDIDTLNITRMDDFYKYWKPNSIKYFFAEHVWEHLTIQDAIEAVKNCFYFLQEGGLLRIAVPDGLHPDSDYIDYVKPGGKGPGSEDHKILYTYKTLSKMLMEAGFKTELLEYWDECGEFNAVEWDVSKGIVRRSKKYDPRNQGGELKYTSIIIDAIKPHHS